MTTALSGGNGNDVIIGGTGDDTQTGGDDFDIFFFSTTGGAMDDGSDTVTDLHSFVHTGETTDMLYFNDAAYDSAPSALCPVRTPRPIWMAWRAFRSRRTRSLAARWSPSPGPMPRRPHCWAYSTTALGGPAGIDSFDDLTDRGFAITVV